MPTPKQLGLLHVAKKQLALDDDDYRAILLVKGGGALSGKDLDRAGFDGVMAYFTALGFRSGWTKRTFGRRQGMASPEQVDLIRALWRDWHGGDDEAALNAWLERSFKIAALRFARPDVAGKAINGLRAMLARRAGQGKRAGGR